MEPSIRVLHVEDDVEFASMTAAYLEQEGAFEVTTIHDAREALDHVTEVDCVVTDYEMPGIDGIDFLRQVRERDPDIPFILFTGKGSEEVAAEAISAGVTDYLQKRGTGQYTLLANRIENYVTKRRTEDERFRGYQAIERAREGISLLDPDGRFIYVNGAFTEMVGYDREELLGEHYELVYRPEDTERVLNEVLPAAADGGWTGRLVYRQRNGETVLTNQSLSMTEKGQFICIAQDLTDEERRRRELLEAKRFESLVNAVTEYAIFMLDTEGQVVTWNDGAERIEGYGRDEILGEHISQFFTDSDVAAGVPDQLLAEALANESIESEGWRVRKDGTRFWANVVLTAVYDESGDHVGYAKVVRDQTKRREREQELERQREALATAARTNAIHRDITRRIVDNSSREGIVGDVCDQLATSGQYRFAIAVEQSPDNGYEVERAAGIDPDAAAYLFDRTADPELVEAAWQGGEVRVQRLDDRVDLEHELVDVIEAVVYVPLVYRETVYGLVCLYSDHAEATTTTVEQVLGDVGAAAGYGIHAIETERLLQADGVVELTFRTTDDETFLGQLTTGGGTATLERLVPASAQQFLLYVAYEGLTTEAFVEQAERHPHVEEWTVLYDSDAEEGGLAVVTETSSLIARLVEVGAKVHTAESVDGRLELVVDVSPSTDIGHLAETVRSVSPGARLISKHRVARPVKRTRAITDGVEAKLTERQLAALQAAYHGGYFDRPRKQTAEEVAATMGISASTFHQHLRIALDTVLTELFE